MSLVSGNIDVETLLLSTGSDSVSCLHLDRVSGLLVVGSTTGAVRLVFPAQGQLASNEKSDQDRDVEAAGESEQQVSYEWIVLKKRSNEGIRTAYLDGKSGRLLVSAGDAAIQVWNLRRLEQANGEARCEMYAFQRHHSFGTCVNAFLFQHKTEFHLIVRNSITCYELSFSKECWGDNVEASAFVNRLGDLKPEHSAKTSRVQPNQKETSLTTSDSTLPCNYDGHFMVFLRCENAGEYSIDVRDWKDKDKSVVQTISFKRPRYSQATPTCIQSLGDFVLAVLDLNVIHVWSIRSGKLLYTLKGHSSGSQIVAARLMWPTGDVPHDISRQSSDSTQVKGTGLEVPVILSLASDKSFVLWSEGSLVQKISLPQTKAHFNLHGPYFIEPVFGIGPDGRTSLVQSLIYNDDTGIHKALVR